MTFPNPAEEAKRWLRFARADLLLVEDLVNSPHHPPHIACYHAQQAVEKALKAILVYLQMRFPFSHDLDEIRNLVPSTWTVPVVHQDLSWLRQWAVEGRYPGNWPEATDRDAQTAASQARAVWETVLDDLDAHGLDVSAFR
ncbi:MAG: HEPN domain-containing protein [Chloroflexota bacterium]